MWCNCDATVPLDLFTPRRAKCVLFCSPWAPRSSFQLRGWGWLQYINPRCTFDVSGPITSRAFSASTSPFVRISINHSTTFQYIVLNSYFQYCSRHLRVCASRSIRRCIYCTGKPLRSFLCNYRALSDPSIVQKTKTTQYSSTRCNSVVDVFIFIEYFLQTFHHSYIYLRCNTSTYWTVPVTTSSQYTTFISQLHFSSCMT